MGFFSCLRGRMPCLWSKLIPQEVSAGAGRDGQHCLPGFLHVQQPLGHQLWGCHTPEAASAPCQAAAASSCPTPCPSCPSDGPGQPDSQLHGRCSFTHLCIIHRFISSCQWDMQHNISKGHFLTSSFPSRLTSGKGCSAQVHKKQTEVA